MTELGATEAQVLGGGDMGQTMGQNMGPEVTSTYPGQLGSGGDPRLRGSTGSVPAGAGSLQQRASSRSTRQHMQRNLDTQAADNPLSQHSV